MLTAVQVSPSAAISESPSSPHWPDRYAPPPMPDVFWCPILHVHVAAALKETDCGAAALVRPFTAHRISVQTPPADSAAPSPRQYASYVPSCSKLSVSNPV